MDSESNDEFFDVSLKYLSIRTLQLISKFLNPPKVLATNENYQRDWRGLADLTGCTSEEVSAFSATPDPTLSVLKRWCNQEESSVKLLLSYFEKLDRFDVYDDSISLIISDIKFQKTSNKTNIDTSSFLTQKDHEFHQKGLPLIQYDAYILYADEDIKFAKELILTLESKYKLKIFMKERDLIGGAIVHDATLKIIINRCNRIITILSPAFLKTTENKYFLRFAQSIGIEQRKRKMIPCIYKDCEIPIELKPLYALKYTSDPIFGDFFEKLYDAIIPTHIAKRSAQSSTTPLSIAASSMSTLSVSENNLEKVKHNSLPDLNQENNETSLPVEEKDKKKKSIVKKFFQKKVFKKKSTALKAT